jgi:hypothetical protein
MYRTVYFTPLLRHVSVLVEPLSGNHKVSKYFDTSHYIAVEVAQHRYDNMHVDPTHTTPHVIGDSLIMFRCNADHSVHITRYNVLCWLHIKYLNYIRGIWNIKLILQNWKVLDCD